MFAASLVLKSLGVRAGERSSRCASEVLAGFLVVLPASIWCCCSVGVVSVTSIGVHTGGMQLARFCLASGGIGFLLFGECLHGDCCRRGGIDRHLHWLTAVRLSHPMF